MTSPRRIVVTEKHAVKDLLVDPKRQREFRPAWGKWLTENLDVDYIGIMLISKRKSPSGKTQLFVMNGQHRRFALLAAGMDDFVVTCEVYLGLTLAEESRMFRGRNKQRHVRAFDDYVQGVLGEDAECVAIHKILDARELKVTEQSQDGSVRAIAAVRQVHRSGENALAETLDVLTASYGTTADAMEGALIQGVGIMVTRYNGELDRAALVRKLQKRPGGPLKLVGDARGAKETFGGMIARAVAMVARETYNRGRRNGQLAPL